MAGHNKELYVVVGPTAAGKTELGAALARKLGGAVVSADSRQVYAGMDVGTAKALPSKSKSQSPNDQQNPNGKLQMTNCVASAHDVFTPDIVDGVEQYLLNICEPDDRLTLAAWQKAALAVIDRLSARDATPLLVGGTMLYVDSVVRNYDIPQAKGDHAFRAQKETLGAEQLYRELIEKDPAARAFIQPHNKRRIIRALEVMAATGRPFSDQRQARPARYDATMIGLFPGWDQLGEAITRRAQQMLSGGLLDETRHLIDRFGRDLSLLQTINYRQALAVLAGEMTEQEALEEMVRANLRYARRQMSWWRGRREVAWYTGAAEAMREI